MMELNRGHDPVRHAARPPPGASAGVERRDPVEEASEESFPASDPPAWSGGSWIGGTNRATQPAGPDGQRRNENKEK